MKKILLYTLIICLPYVAFSQKKIPAEIKRYKDANFNFEKLSIFENSEDKSVFKNEKIIKDASYVSLKLMEFEKIIINQYQTIELQIQFKSQPITIELYRVNIFSSGFNIKTDTKENIIYSKGQHYRGIIKGDENSIASFNFFENEMNGIISSTELGNINIGKLIDSPKYIIYSDSDLLVNTEFTCNTKDEKTITQNSSQNNRNNQSNKCVSTYLEIGYQAYLANGSNLTTTTNWITSIFNNSQTLFNNDGISISLKTIFIWTQNDYYSYSSNFILPAFTNIRPDFDGDVGFIADIDPGQLGGQAFGIGRLCTDRKYAYGDFVLSYSNIPTYSQPVYVLTHELGHVLGSHHTHACVWNGNNTAIDGCAPSYYDCPTPYTPPGTLGTIMSYCFPNFSLGFGEQPANAIIQHIENSSCLSSNCIDSCINTIGRIQTLNVTQNSTLIQWSDSNTTTTQWEISVVPHGSEPVWNLVNTNSYFIDNLNSNSYYEVTVRGSCANNLTYPNHSKTFATQGDNCDGITIYDTGGANNGYKATEHIIRTIVPTVPGKKIKLTFLNLDLVEWDGWLFIYDGLNNNGPLLNYLTFGYPFLAYGFGSDFYPNQYIFESQDPSGALTLEFFSSPFYFYGESNNGWEATVECINTLGNDEYGDGFIDYSFAPNPTKGLLSIKSKDPVDKIMVYSTDGKLVLETTPLSNNFEVDVSNLSTGAYTVSLTIMSKNTSFKVIKE
ncbi:MAG: zinc-dependent metalloprotease [Flavobacteriales bacterium]|nr:zinc-dependent metalloprotease [Flavobacteriales bacterium]